MNELRFSIPEMLSLIGVTQCVYILVYMLLRSGKLARAGLPLIYFFVLGSAFAYDFASNAIGQYIGYYYYFQWAAWALGPPLSAPLIVQIAQINKPPHIRHYWVLLLIPAAFAVSYFASAGSPECAQMAPCEDMRKWLTLTGFIAGCVSLLTIWINRNVLSFAADKRTGKDRYWLILALVFANIFFLLAMLLSLGATDHNQITLVRTVLGLAFVYLVGTSLFRIYPQAVLAGIGSDKEEGLSKDELEIAHKIERLLTHEKVYHESAYARTDLAHECQTSEAIISRVINLHFKKSFPQIINEYRVEDAKALLEQTEASIKTVAEEVGFNSLASFNRVFREVAGETPSEYRKKAAKPA